MVAARYRGCDRFSPDGDSTIVPDHHTTVRMGKSVAAAASAPEGIA
jgi:hypothetical protein